VGGAARKGWCGSSPGNEDTMRQLERIVSKARLAGVVVIQEYQAA
jgi:hypothetical protein